ncbi:hypothetical protein DERP_012445 [Dermatophagoides pteronyssinus]|uniref:Uncharacterized protein n=1 Tax=Dermatophagoides pteronyssinus TaxID=6956 RepID=A0ABQ8IXM5_DERPT|nr:hypothetical protein DERP_012445 [Dermatophagoides pteronyssinus]
MPESSDQSELIKETELLCSMCAHLPIGLNRHLNMMACLITYNARNSTDIDSEEIWRYFHTKYHQDRLNDLHKIPFPNDEMDFDLYECDDFKELIDKRRKEEKAKITESQSVNKDGPAIEASDDNTLSGASTPVNTTPQLPTRKRKSTTSSSSTTAENSGTADKSQTITPSRRRDRSDSEKTETKHSHRHRSDKDSDKMDKNQHSSANTSTKDTPSSSSSTTTKRVRSVSKRPVRNSPANVTTTNSSTANNNTTTSKSSSSTPSSSSSSNRKHDKKHK